jgi:hypothetical protein
VVVVTDLRKEPRRGSLLGGGWPHSRVVVESHLRKEKKKFGELVLYKQRRWWFHGEHGEHSEKREERRESTEWSEEREKNQLK